jgi:hypothetical protein
LPEDTVIFFSCRVGQLSYEREELGHGLFTHCVLERLRENAIADGEIAWDDLVAYTIRRMAHDDLTQHMPAEQRQVPIQAGAMPHMVLGTRVASASVARPTPMPTTAVSRSAGVHRYAIHFSPLSTRWENCAVAC